MTRRRRTLPLGGGYAFHLGTHPGYWNLGRVDVLWRGETVVRGWCFGPFELQHWKHGVNHLVERKYDRLCTSPRRHHCRPGRWRDDDRDACERWLHWHYWLGRWRCPSDPLSPFPEPMQLEPWLPRIYDYLPVVRLLAGLSWRRYPHPCTLVAEASG